eukprot:TRINITY_DN3773_c0_g1_i2.p1 TRINITY_DN3773_c0_g1~~TRINITY_DN3773_c0_g1_i2.p1  ORF type:complete len:241 (-),score=42.13 TRINITY_DN3773_c0_g1_i2:34-756(-)
MQKRSRPELDLRITKAFEMTTEEEAKNQEMTSNLGRRQTVLVKSDKFLDDLHHALAEVVTNTRAQCGLIVPRATFSIISASSRSASHRNVILARQELCPTDEEWEAVTRPREARVFKIFLDAVSAMLEQRGLAVIGATTLGKDQNLHFLLLNAILLRVNQSSGLRAVSTLIAEDQRTAKWRKSVEDLLEWLPTLHRSEAMRLQTRRHCTRQASSLRNLAKTLSAEAVSYTHLTLPTIYSV